MHDEIRVAIDADPDDPTGPTPAGPSVSHVTVLSGLILLLISILLVLVGAQSIETERLFFQRTALGVNREIADLLARQVVQVFTAATGLVEDASRYPAVRRGIEPSQAPDEARGIIEIVTGRNPVLRSLSARHRHGQLRFRAVAVNTPEPRGLGEDLREGLLEGDLPAALTAPYTAGDGVLALGFGVPIQGRRVQDQAAGVLEAELSLRFLEDIVQSVRVGNTGKVLVVDREGKVVLSTAGFEGDALSVFHDHFPITRAFHDERGGRPYGGDPIAPTYLASYRTLRSASRKGFDAQAQLGILSPVPFTSTVNPREVPDWLVVVQQDTAEGLALADRMRLNVMLLVGIGLVGISIIGKLWWDARDWAFYD